MTVAGESNLEDGTPNIKVQAETLKMAESYRPIYPNKPTPRTRIRRNSFSSLYRWAWETPNWYGYTLTRWGTRRALRRAQITARKAK